MITDLNLQMSSGHRQEISVQFGLASSLSCTYQTGVEGKAVVEFLDDRVGHAVLMFW